MVGWQRCERVQLLKTLWVCQQHRYSMNSECSPQNWQIHANLVWLAQTKPYRWYHNLSICCSSLFELLNTTKILAYHMQPHQEFVILYDLTLLSLVKRFGCLLPYSHHRHVQPSPWLPAGHSWLVLSMRSQTQERKLESLCRTCQRQQPWSRFVAARICPRVTATHIWGLTMVTVSSCAI